MFLATLFKSNFSEHLFLRTSLDDCFGSFKLHNSRGVLNVFSAWRCSVKNVFLKFFQNSQENTGGGRLQHRCLPQNFTIFFKSTYSLGFYDNCPRVKLPPNPKTNPDPNPNPNRGGNFPRGAIVLIPSFRTAASGATILLLPIFFSQSFSTCFF